MTLGDKRNSDKVDILYNRSTVMVSRTLSNGWSCCASKFTENAFYVPYKLRFGDVDVSEWQIRAGAENSLANVVIAWALLVHVGKNILVNTNQRGEISPAAMETTTTTSKWVDAIIFFVFYFFLLLGRK